MNSSGYVYVLLNPSIQGMVKIGMTTRDPENRVDELSNATGVATPFILVYKEYFNDCHLAEKQLHSILEHQNYRVSNNREFFTISVHEAIKLVQDLKSQNQTSTFKEDTVSIYTNNDINKLAIDILDEAENYYYGREGKLEDYEEALKLFKKAAKFGALEAYWYLGNIYKYGNGVKDDLKTAMEFYKQGAKLGWVDCFAEMGIIYSNSFNRDFIHKENAIKCWSTYFGDIKNSKMIEMFIGEYISIFLKNRWEISNNIILSNYKKRIIQSCDINIERHSLDSQSDYSNFVIKKNIQVKQYFEHNVESRESEIVQNEGQVTDLFKVSESAVLIVSIYKGQFNAGDSIFLSNEMNKIKTRVMYIEKDRSLVEYAIKGDSVGIMVEGDYNDFCFMKNGGFIETV